MCGEIGILIDFKSQRFGMQVRPLPRAQLLIVDIYVFFKGHGFETHYLHKFYKIIPWG